MCDPKKAIKSLKPTIFFCKLFGFFICNISLCFQICFISYENYYLICDQKKDILKQSNHLKSTMKILKSKNFDRKNMWA